MNDIKDQCADRRSFLRKTGLLLTSAAFLYPVGPMAQAKSPEKKEESKGEDVSPPEDLMREHGVLQRILLVYEDIQGRLIKGEKFPREVLSAAAGIIYRFIENYHEKLEEDFLFPRFTKEGKLVELVRILREQHQAGRELTAYIMKSADTSDFKQESGAKELAEKLHLFIRMYRPHAAREDTVLFPALRSIVSASEFDSLGDEFEKKEQALFGEGGFEKIVETLTSLEKPLGIDDLARFTPRT